MRPTVLVTGATGGIGRAICEELGRRSFTVFAHYNTRADEAAELQRRVVLGGGSCELIHSDLSAPHGPDEVRSATHDLLERQQDLQLRGIVNNAAVMLGPSFADVTSEAFDTFFNLNVRAPMLITSLLLPYMADGSSVVNISSASAHISSPGNPLYAMTKVALESFGRNLAADVADRQIRVNSVVPGYTDNGNAAFRDPKTLEYMSSLSALGGVASPRDVAGAVAFLLSEESSRMTGGVVDISGGTTLSPRGKNLASSVRDVIPNE